MATKENEEPANSRRAAPVADFLTTIKLLPLVKKSIHHPSESMQFPPRHICIAAALLIASGVGSIVGMVAAVVSGKFSFDLGFVGIPIGYGLLIGRSSSRRWALLFSCLGLILAGALVGSFGFDHFTGKQRISYADGIYTAVELTILTAGCLYVLFSLLRKQHKQWFAEIQPKTDQAIGLAWAIVVVAFVLNCSKHTLDWWAIETHSRIFPLNVEVTPYNSETGEGITSLTYSSGNPDLFGSGKGKFPKLSLGTTGGMDGLRILISGVAIQPVEVVAKSEGFHDLRITIDGNTEDKIRVPMTPLRKVAGENTSSD